MLQLENAEFVNSFLFLHFLIALFTRSTVKICTISRGVLLVSLISNRVSLEGVCLPRFEVFKCCLNLLVSCLSDDNIEGMCFVLCMMLCFALLPIPLIVPCDWLDLSCDPWSQRNQSSFSVCVYRCGSGCHNSVLAIQAM